MSLSEAEIRLLREEYRNLQYYIFPENQELFLQKEEEIIQYCIDNSVRLYNIVQLKQSQAVSLLQQLLSYFIKPMNDFDRERISLEKICWVVDFDVALDNVSKELADIHDQARPTLGQMYLRENSIPLATLLNQQDMIDLLNVQEYRSDDILTTEPFSLTTISSDQLCRIQALLNTEENSEKDVFLVASHDGHWFYLSRHEGSWSVQDSQPADGMFFTPRQQSIFDESKNFLTRLLDGQNYGELIYETTGKQTTHYDCGTQVVNAYRSLVDDDYDALSHRAVIAEVLSIQLPEIEYFNVVGDDFFDFDEEDLLSSAHRADESVFDDLPVQQPIDPNKVAQVIETTVSSQIDSDKAELYREHLHELVEQVISKGLFAKVKQPIELDKINSAEADLEAGESDQEFATRLQEAEFRNAGLKK